MATLVLSSAGGALAGPLGSAVGSAVGTMVDQSLFGPPSRQVPDLRLQTSSYGQPIAAVYGRLRVAGTVIWASELVESALVGKTGGGLSYSVSFAVAISSRPIAAVKRIWADGRLIRGRAGDHKIPFSFRLQSGDEDQAVDPLIAAAEGASRAPAHRGLAVVVFEDFDLSTFGNRIPQLNLEVESIAAPPTAVSLTTGMLELYRGELDGGDVISGIGLEGANVAECLRPVVETFGLAFDFRNGRWECGARAISHLIDWRELQSVTAGTPTTPVQRRGSGTEPPTRISICYFDEALDFATGEKSSHLPGTSRATRILFPGSLTGDQAKGLASAALSRAWADRIELDVALPLSRHSIAVGDSLILPNQGTRAWKVVRKRLGPAGLIFSLRGIVANAEALPSESGRGLTARDEPPGELKLEVIELPADGEANRPTMVVAACGGPSPWIIPRIEVTAADKRYDIAGPRRPSLIGQLLHSLPAGCEGLFDDESRIVVKFPNGASLTGASDAAVLAGENCAWVGGEVIRFGIAEQIGENVFCLRHLLRGLYDSGAAGHVAGTPFVVLEPDRLSGIDISPDQVGGNVAVRMTTADGQTRESAAIFRSHALTPWRPAHLRATSKGDAVSFVWARRGPGGLAWHDRASAQDSEIHGVYRARLSDAEGRSVEATTSGQHWDVPLIDLQELGEGTWSFEVAEFGPHGLGPAARKIIERWW